jgi:hypothetical protein
VIEPVNIKLKKVPLTENNKIKRKYFKVDSILELYDEQNIIIGRIKVKNNE